MVLHWQRPCLRPRMCPLISDNYFCRLATTTFAGGSAVRTACATVRSRELRPGAGARGAPDGQRQAGPLAEEEADGKQDDGGGRVGRRDERADGGHVAARSGALGDEGGARVADAPRPVRGGVGDGDRAAAGGGQGREAGGEDDLRGAVPQEAGRVRGRSATHVAAAGAGGAGGGRGGQRGGVSPGGPGGGGGGGGTHAR